MNDDLGAAWCPASLLLEGVPDERLQPDERLFAAEPPSLLEGSRTRLLQLLRAPLVGGRLAQR
jgi:hypothetical protein